MVECWLIHSTPSHYQGSESSDKTALKNLRDLSWFIDGKIKPVNSFYIFQRGPLSHYNYEVVRDRMVRPWVKALNGLSKSSFVAFSCILTVLSRVLLPRTPAV
jgi:hypothetical protein